MELVIVSDDLTGANDTGAQFAKQGFRTISLLDINHMECALNTEVCVINAETRSLQSEAAYNKVKEICKSLSLQNVPYVYKKIDSTMRGNIGREIDAMLDNEHFNLAVVTPAYPQNGRISVGGYLLVNHQLLEDSETSLDPKSPIRLSHLPTLIGVQSKKSVGHINISSIRSKDIVLQNEIRKHLSQGIQILVFDTVSHEDFQSIIDAVSKEDLRVLWVGSAGLAQNLSSKIMRQRRDRIAETVIVQENRENVLVIAGSVSATTRQQIDALSERKNCEIICVKPLELLKIETRDVEINRVIRRSLKLMDIGKMPILTTDTSDASRKLVDEWLTQQKLDSLYAANCIADCLGRIGKHITQSRKLLGLVLTGGDIAYRTCEHLQVKALRILDEVEDGIPFAQVVNGEFEDLLVVTKAGAFGNSNSLVHVVEKIKSYTKENGMEMVQ